MRDDVITLVKLEIRRLKRDASYWLRLLGFDPSSSLLYRAYIAAFWLFWLFAMWAFVVEQVHQASQQIPAQDAAALLNLLPPIVFLLQVGYLIGLFRDPPLKLRSPDLSYVAASPVSRSAVTVINCVRNLLIPAALLSLLGALAAMFFAWSLDVPEVGTKGLAASLVTFSVVYLSGPTCWVIALLKQNRGSASSKRMFWLAIPALLFAAWRIPGVFLWPGNAWIELIRDGLLVTDIVLLLVSIVAAFVALHIVGNHVHMTRVMDDSQLYARIQKLGFWGGMIASDVTARIHQQSRLAGKRVLKQRLPSALEGNSALCGRSFVVSVRLSPGLVVRLIISGMTFVSVVVGTVAIGGYAHTQTWLLLLLVLLQVRPNELTRLFREHIQQPFLRQFLPENNLLLFVSETGLPFLLTCLGMSIAIVLQPWITPVVALALAIGVLTALALCQALETVHLPYVLTSLNYEYAIVVLGFTVVGMGKLMHSVWAALFATLVIDILLGLLLYHSTSA